MTQNNSIIKILIASGICFLSGFTLSRVRGLAPWLLITIPQSCFLLLPFMLRFNPVKLEPTFFRKPECKDILLVLLLTISFAPLASFLTSLSGHFLPGFTEHLQKINAMALPGGLGVSEPALFILLALLPAICEEFFFRGYLITALERGSPSRTLPLFLSAFLFALIHMDPYYFTALFCYGIILGIIFLVTRSIWLTALSHLINNSLSLLALRLLAEDAARGLPGLFSLSAVLLMMIPLTLTAVILIHLTKRHRERRHVL